MKKASPVILLWFLWFLEILRPFPFKNPQSLDKMRCQKKCSLFDVIGPSKGWMIFSDYTGLVKDVGVLKWYPFFFPSVLLKIWKSPQPEPFGSFFWNRFPDAKEADSADGCDSGVVNAMSGVELVSTLFDGTKTYHQLDQDVASTNKWVKIRLCPEGSATLFTSNTWSTSFNSMCCLWMISLFFLKNNHHPLKNMSFKSRTKSRTHHPPTKKYIIHFFGGHLESTTP